MKAWWGKWCENWLPNNVFYLRLKPPVAPVAASTLALLGLNKPFS